MNQPENRIKQSDNVSSSSSSTRVCSACGLAWETSTNTCPRDGTVLSTPIETDPAFTNYEYIETCGEGGMGVVYKARQKILDKIVAIKMLHPRLLSADAIVRFQREGKSASMLEHPYIIKVLDLGVSSSGPYMILEFLKGQTLAQVLITEGPLSIERFLHLFIQVCDALEHAHSRGVLHRDLKPSNLMLTGNFRNEEEIRIMDFGIAKFVGESSQESFASKLTRTGEAIGSPSYMSPEQTQNANIDGRSDLYSLGCVMYEALTGAPPFARNTALETLMAHINEQPLTMGQSVLGTKTFDDDLERIIARLLQKDPDLRFQSMNELKQQLVALRDGQGLGKFVYEDPTAKQRKKRPPLIAAVVLAIVATGCLSLCIIKALNLNLFNQVKPSEQRKVVGLMDSASEFKTTRALTDPIAVQVDKGVTEFSVGAEGLTTDDDLKPLESSKAVKITLRKASITGDGLKYIENIPTLKVLSLPQSIVQNLQHVQNMKSLEELDLDKTYITDAQLEPISHLHLKRIDLSSTNVSTLQALKNMQSLQVVALNRARELGSDGMKVLGQLTNLKHLYLNHTNISKEDLQYLTNLSQIQEIQLYYCPKLTEADVLALNGKLPSDCLVRYNPSQQQPPPTAGDKQQEQLNAASDKLMKAQDLFSSGHWQEAQPLFKDSLTSLEKVTRPNWMTIFNGYQSYANNSLNLHNADVALACARKRLDILQQHPDVDKSNLPGIYQFIGDVYASINQPKKAVPEFEHASQLYDSTPPMYPPDASPKLRAAIDNQWTIQKAGNLLQLFSVKYNPKADAATTAPLIPLLERALQLFCTDPSHVNGRDTAEYRRQLAELYFQNASLQTEATAKMRRLNQAAEQFSLAKKVIDHLPHDRDIYNELLYIDARLGAVDVDKHEYGKAEAIFKKQLEIGDVTVRRRSLNWLKKLCTEDNRPEEAAKYDAELAKLSTK